MAITQDRRMPGDFIYGADDVLRMLDQLLVRRDGRWWDEFFEDRAKPCPFFVDWPDENLVEWFEGGQLPKGRALELGCGHGRNAIYLAAQGWTVDAVDFSAEALEWAAERAEHAGVEVAFQRASIFDADIPAGAYDLVYDSGCFHHLPPHRRAGHVELTRRALRPGGRFGLVCFRPEGGSGLSDQDVYEQRGTGGGLGYTEESLRMMWDQGGFETHVLRQMIKSNGHEDVFGEDFLWVLLATRV